MPEEINRVVTDDLSTLLFCPTDQAVENLKREGITAGVFLVGDVMCDALRRYDRLATQRYLKSPPQVTGLFAEVALPATWYLANIHRVENTRDEQKLAQIIEAFEQLDIPVLFVTHPRTQPLIERLFAQKEYANTLFIQPVGYLEMLYLSARARKIITDSGGLQKEAYMLGVPCVTVREQTEWVETLYDGWNVLVDATSNAVIAGVVDEATDERYHRELYGDGHAAERITACLTEWL
jgi:UDP-N-acetylglucosamine 2-epimerase (non-hydrolysing)/UDP-GlcNAc3NAcA epimerase